MYSGWLDALYLLGLSIYALVHLLTYLLTYTVGWLGAYKAGNISETVEDRAKATISAYIKSYTGFRLPPRCMTLNDLWARFKAIDSLNAAKMAKYNSVMTPMPCRVLCPLLIYMLHRLSTWFHVTSCKHHESARNRGLVPASVILIVARTEDASVDSCHVTLMTILILESTDSDSSSRLACVCL